MNNIDIQVKGEFVDMPETSVRLEKVNPFFITELFQGDYSFPFEIPATEKNLRLFGFANYIDVSNRILKMDAWLFLFGAPHSKTMLTITRARKSGFSIVLTGGIKSLKSADMKLAEIPLGKDVLLGASISQIISHASLAGREGNWNVYGYTFVPFKQEKFYDDKNSDFVGVVNQANSPTGDIMCANSLVNGNPHCLVPWLFLFYVLNKIFEYEGLTPAGSFWNHHEYRRLLLTNNFALDGGLQNYNLKVKVVQDQNVNAFGERIYLKLGPEGTYDNSLGAWNNTPGQTGSFYKILKPGKYIVDIVLEVLVWSFVPGIIQGDTATVQLMFDFVEVARYDFSKAQPPGPGLGDPRTGYISYELNASIADIGKPLFLEFLWAPGPPYPNAILTIKPGTFMAIYEDTPVNSLTDTLKFKNHVPDWTVGELLGEVKKMGVNLDFDFQNNTITLDTVDVKLNSFDIADWSQKAEPGYELDMEESGKGVTIFYEFPEEEKVNLKFDPAKYKGEFVPGTFLPLPTNLDEWAIIADTNEIFRVGKNISGANEWQFAGYNYRPYIIGAGEMELTSKLSPVQMTYALNAGGTADQNLALMPLIHGRGSSELFGIGINPAPPRLVFWRGRNREITTNPKGGMYVLASTGFYSINGDITGEISLRLDRPNGMILKNSEKLYRAINEGVVIEKDILLQPRDVFNLKAFFKVNLDYNVWVLKSISVVISKRLARAKAYLLKL